MKFRKLRIAWSVMCAIACVLLIGLWMRSLVVDDYLGYCYSNSRELSCRSIIGRLEFNWGFNPFSEGAPEEWLFLSHNIEEIYGVDHSEIASPMWAFNINSAFLYLAV